MMPAPDAVVFDLGNVLIDWNPRYLYRKLFDDAAEMERFIEAVLTPDWVRAWDIGRPFADGIAELAGRHPHYRDEIEAFHRRWSETMAGPIDGTVDILAALRARGTPLYALTNWSAETFPLARPRFPFLEWFRDIVVSGDVKIGKPDPRIYRLLLERNGLAAGRAVFIDDSKANVAGAEAVGMRAFHFTSPAALRRDLAALGLLEGRP